MNDDTPNTAPLNDPDLTAYALGELEPGSDAADRIEALLAATPEAAAYVDQVRALGEELSQKLATPAAGLSDAQQQTVEQAATGYAPGVAPATAADAQTPPAGPLRFPRKALLAAGLALAAGAAITTAVLLDTTDGPDPETAVIAPPTHVNPSAQSAINQLQSVALFNAEMSADFDATPLNDALAAIGRATGARIDVDWTGLNRRGINPETPITFKVDKAPAGAVLALVLQASWNQSPHPDPVIWTAADHGIRIEPRSAAVQRRLAESQLAFEAHRVSHEPVKPDLFALTPDITALSPETFIANPQTRVNLRRQRDAAALAGLQERLAAQVAAGGDPEEAERALAAVVRNLAAHKESLADIAVARGQLLAAGEYYLEAVSLNADDVEASTKHSRVQELRQAFQEPVVEVDPESPMAGIGKAEASAHINRALTRAGDAMGAGRFVDAFFHAYHAQNLLRIHQHYFDQQGLYAQLLKLNETASAIHAAQQAALAAAPEVEPDPALAQMPEALNEEVTRRLHIAREYQIQRDYGLALGEIDVALRLDPKNEAAQALQHLYQDIAIGVEGQQLHRGLSQMRANHRMLSERLVARDGDIVQVEFEGLPQQALQWDTAPQGSTQFRWEDRGEVTDLALFGDGSSSPVSHDLYSIPNYDFAAPGNSAVAAPRGGEANLATRFDSALYFDHSAALSNTSSPNRPAATPSLSLPAQRGFESGIVDAEARWGVSQEWGRPQLQQLADQPVQLGVDFYVSGGARVNKLSSFTDESLSWRRRETRFLRTEQLSSGLDGTHWSFDSFESTLTAPAPDRPAQIEALRRAGIDIDPAELIAPEPFNPGDIYAVVNDNPFLTVFEQPKSTFSVDVDTAGYSIIRRQINQQNVLPQPEHVRIEEMINYFTYDYEAPEVDPALLDHGVVTQAALEQLEADQPGFAPFATHTEVTDCPWAEGNKLVRIGVKAMEVADYNRPPAHLTFLIDVSGSMGRPNKLPLVKESLKLLLDQLHDDDKVSIVVYAGASGLVLEAAPAADEQKILEAIENMNSGGGTAGAAGIQLAYQVAQQHFVDGGVNRVILCTDGDFNIGVSDTDDLVALIKDKANPEANDDGVNRGVYLSAMGFGSGNLNDNMMELITNAGNGNYAYIDSLNEATKVMYDQAGATLVTVAKDVKIQVDFDPSQVFSYRLIGYENRILATEDFDNDKVDAGDIGAGHTVTALYEIVPLGDGWGDGPAVKRDLGELEHAIALNNSLLSTARLTEEQQIKLAAATQLLVQEHKLATAMNSRLALADNRVKSAPAPRGAAQPMLIVNLRYKPVDAPAEDGTSRLIEHEVPAAAMAFDQASEDFRFAASVAGLGMALRQSPHFANSGYDWVIDTATDASNHDPHGYRTQFIELAQKARKLAGE